ncbi:hypothetical protein BpHYR1_021534 [Brachionus plicatilis]|uniref:Uncharacterized protein n=1 Tax=Brachionus plicatilis TaxID=10195 RepID=A0A3M7SFL4_BRAPC|nr:hypothetical protein BpHYR1_021534 [Brachionus plicatilis]
MIFCRSSFEPDLKKISRLDFDFRTLTFDQLCNVIIDIYTFIIIIFNNEIKQTKKCSIKIT